MKRFLSVVMVLLVVCSANAVYLGNANKLLEDASVGYGKLGADVDQKFLDTTEAQSLIDTSIGATKLEDLDSVEITAPGANEVLRWNDTTHVWENGSVTGVGDMLKSVYDTVDDGTVNSARQLDADYLGDGLIYDGSSLEIDLGFPLVSGLEFIGAGNSLAVKATDLAGDGLLGSGVELDINLSTEEYGLWIDTDVLKVEVQANEGVGIGATGLYVVPEDLDGAGIGVTGGEFVVIPGNGLQINVDSIEAKLDGGTLSKGAAGLKVSTSGISNNEMADNAIDTPELADDAVGAAEVDWSTPGQAPSENQIGAVAIPIQDAGTFYPTDNVEAALQAIGTTLSGKVSVSDVERAIEAFTTDGANYECALEYEPVWVPQVFYGGSVIQVPTTDYTYSKVGKTVTLIGGESGVKVVVSYEYIAP